MTHTLSRYPPGSRHGSALRLDQRLPDKDITLLGEFIDANELGLALEQMANVLSEKGQLVRDPVGVSERAKEDPAVKAGHCGFQT